MSKRLCVLMPGSCPRYGTWGARIPRGLKNIFFKHVHSAYQINDDNKRNIVQVQGLPWGQTGDLWVRSKGQIAFNSYLQISIPNFVCVLTNKS